MLIGARHTIHDPAVFWTSAQENIPRAPAGIAIVQSLPSMDMTTAICVWEAPSVGALAAWIDGLVGHVSENAFFEVNTANAIGLPASGS